MTGYGPEFGGPRSARARSPISGKTRPYAVTRSGATAHSTSSVTSRVGAPASRFHAARDASGAAFVGQHAVGLHPSSFSRPGAIPEGRR